MHSIDDLPTFTASQLTEARANDFVRLISSMAGHALNSGSTASLRLGDEFTTSLAAKYFAARWPRSLNIDLITKTMDWRQKAAVEPGTTLDPSWASPLAPVRPLIDAFVDVARPNSLIGKLLPSAARVPFNVSVGAATAGGTYAWVGQGMATPVGAMHLAAVTLPVLKAAGIIVVTAELLKLTGPASVAMLRREMIRGMSQYLDQQLTDPTVAAVADESPASITNGAPSIGSAGTSAANAVTDIKALISAFTAANPNAESMALLMSPGVAVALAVATGSTTLTATGGLLFGIAVHTGAIGSRVVILDPSALLIADDGGLDVTISLHGSVEMQGPATSPQTAATIMVSLWQANLAGLKIDRMINFKMARANAVLFTNVAYV